MTTTNPKPERNPIIFSHPGRHADVVQANAIFPEGYPACVSLYTHDHVTDHVTDCAHFTHWTPAQARQLAVHLLLAAETAENYSPLTVDCKVD